MKYLLAIFLIFNLNFAFSQLQSPAFIQWEKEYGIDSALSLVKGIELKDGSFVFFLNTFKKKPSTVI